MRSCPNYPLKSNNSFKVNTCSPRIYFPASLDDLIEITKVVKSPFYILGEGSNTLFVKEKAPEIIKPSFQGVSVMEAEDHYTVIVGAGENWHNLVCYCIDKGIYGLENLALIPGSVGAAPIQNIGAYGVDFADFCHQIEYFDFDTGSLKNLTNAECQFSYRDSVFKRSHNNKSIITKVTLKFSKNWTPQLNYGGLASLPPTVNAKEVMEKVIHLRQDKLPDPQVLPNAGSFFKNPIVNQEEFERLLAEFPNLPNYPQDDGKVKLAAGWLIEKAGLKGFRHKSVGVHDRQALVLVNYADGQGPDIVGLAKFVQQKVQRKFSITIIPEVRMISSEGEVTFDSLKEYSDLGVNNND